MAAASIGIKLADSKFFPVLEEGSPARKILDLTTVRDEQTSVQINLFRSTDGEIDDAEYVGTLIIEDIAEKASGEPTIELTLSLDSSNELSAEAVDLDSGSRQVLTVSLETLDSETLYNVPDFDLTPMPNSLSLGDDPEHQFVVTEEAVPGNAPEGLFEMTEEEKKRNGIFLPTWLFVLILAVGVLALIFALVVSARVMLLNRTLEASAQSSPVTIEAPSVPVVEVAPAPIVLPEAETPPPIVEEIEEPVAVVVEEEVVEPVQPAPVASTKAIRYKIKWGDTLWDLSESYYKTPWMYKKISTYNKIKNPNLIIAGTYIDIPPQ